MGRGINEKNKIEMIKKLAALGCSLLSASSDLKRDKLVRTSLLHYGRILNIFFGRRDRAQRMS